MNSWTLIKNNLHIFLLSCCLSMTAKVNAGEHIELNREYQLKTAYLYNILKFIEWPNINLEHSRDLTFCITDPDPSNGQFLDLDGKTIGNTTIQVSDKTGIEQLDECNIVYVGRRSPFNRHLKTISRKGLLLIGESKDFALRGGIFNFFVEHNKLRFEINLTAAQQSEIVISSKLLRLSRLVTPGKTEAGDLPQ